MSGELQVTPTTDMSAEEQVALTKYMEAGLPDVARVTHDHIYTWFNLYMSGKTYMEIAEQTKTDLNKVLFISHKFQWFRKKNETLANIHSKIGHRVAQAKLQSAAFVADYVAYMHRKLGPSIDRFLAGDASAAGEISSKDLDRYFKAIDKLESIVPEKPVVPPNPPPVTVINNGGTVNVGDPADKAIDVQSRPLKEIAERRRAKKAEQIKR